MNDGVAEVAHRNGYIPIFEVAHKNDLWWSIPAGESKRMYDQYVEGLDVVYTWDWGNSRLGSFVLDGEPTSINRYMIDFETWEQVNIDNNRRRSVRLVWVKPKSVVPKWTGQIPGKRKRCDE